MEKLLITNSKNRIDEIRRRGTGEQTYCATHTRALLSTRPFLRAAICRGGRDRGGASNGLPRRTFDLVVAGQKLSQRSSVRRTTRRRSLATFAGSQSAVVGPGIDAMSIMSLGQN